MAVRLSTWLKQQQKRDTTDPGHGKHIKTRVFLECCVLYFCCLQLSAQGQNHFECDQAAVSVKPIDSSFLV